MKRVWRRRVCVVGFAISALTVVAFFVSINHAIGYFIRDIGGGIVVGSVAFTTTASMPDGLDYERIQRGRGLPDVVWWPFSKWGNVYVPLWMVFLLVFVPTLIVWRRSRRFPPGHCQNCGYDLTGNVSGICSECGTRISE